MKNLMTLLAVVFVGINIYAVKHFGDLGLIPKEVFVSIVWGSVVATVITIATASTIYFTKKLK